MNEIQNFLMNISISDEGMEDLEMFNKKYNEKIINFKNDEINKRRKYIFGFK